jgi:hypothetical protein
LPGLPKSFERQVCTAAPDIQSRRGDCSIAGRPHRLAGHQCGWFEQATSYCDTDALLREFCGWEPAYFDPALLLSPVNGEPPPGALPALPGVFPLVSQDCIGWPVACCGEFVWL